MDDVISRKVLAVIARDYVKHWKNFFNGLNVLFYFPTILPNLVFIEPQMLLDKVSELVDETYNMRQGDKLQPMVGERLKFRDYGQVTEKFLSEFKSHYEPPLFTPKELITLLRGLLVLADLSEGVYFMPCLLRVESSEVVTKHRMSNEKALALHFPDGGPLMGMFCCTVAYLLSPDNTHPCPWKVVENEAGTPECLHRNVIEFEIPKKAGTISLIDYFTHFEIHICTHRKKADELWKLVHDGVFAGLKKAGKTIGYTNNTPIPAIVCPAHPATPHPATVDGSVWTCSQMSKKFGDIPEDDPIPWLSVCDTHSECTLSPPPQATTQPAITLSPPPVPSPATLPSATISSEPEGAMSIGIDDVISRKVLAVIARDYVKHWKILGPFLDLSRQQEIAITETYPNNYHLQKWECQEPLIVPSSQLPNKLAIVI